MVILSGAPSSQGAQRSEPPPDEKQPRILCILPFVMGDVYGRMTVEPDPENDITAIDALGILRKIVGEFLPDNLCSPLDIDCDFDVDAADALWILRWIADLPYSQNEPCPDFGDEL